MTLSTQLHSYRGDQFNWCTKPEYPRKTKSLANFIAQYCMVHQYRFVIPIHTINIIKIKILFQRLLDAIERNDLRLAGQYITLKADANYIWKEKFVSCNLYI